MDAIRARFGSAIEWVVAAAFLLATLAIGSLIVREFRVVSTAAPVPGEDTEPTALPGSVPARAISVPVLLLLDGKEIRVNDTATHVAALLGRAAEVGKQDVDRGSLGERFTRFYEHASTQFILVFEPSEPRGEPRVSSIYLH